MSCWCIHDAVLPLHRGLPRSSPAAASAWDLPPSTCVHEYHSSQNMACVHQQVYKSYNDSTVPSSILGLPHTSPDSAWDLPLSTQYQAVTSFTSKQCMCQGPASFNPRSGSNITDTKAVHSSTNNTQISWQYCPFSYPRPPSFFTRFSLGLASFNPPPGSNSIHIKAVHVSGTCLFQPTTRQ